MTKTRELGLRACAIHSTGRAVPVVIPVVLSLWLLLDATSPLVTGPFDWAGWQLDHRIRLVHRVWKEITDVASLVARLLG